jgi:hypothetical protein
MQIVRERELRCSSGRLSFNPAAPSTGWRRDCAIAD